MLNETAPTPQDVAKILRQTPDVLAAIVANLDDELLSWRPAEDEWCIKEVVGHLIEMDTLAFADRIRLILTEDHPEIPSVNVNKIAAERRDCQRAIGDLLAEFRAERKTAVTFLNTLPPTNLSRTGNFLKYGTFRASDFLYEWPYHDHDHLKQISTNIQTAVWPHLSSTMQHVLKS